MSMLETKKKQKNRKQLARTAIDDAGNMFPLTQV